MHLDPGEGTVTPQETEPDLPISCGGTSQQGPAMETGTSAAADLRGLLCSATTEPPGRQLGLVMNLTNLDTSAGLTLTVNLSTLLTLVL